MARSVRQRRREQGRAAVAWCPARAERDWLTAELAAATGLGGRTRRFTDSRERARIAVGKSIRRILQHIAEADAMIGQHLRRPVRTGARCSYWPG
jgi:hypothetical protein